MAFGAVETGIMKPMLAPSVAPSAGSTGRTPAACATAMATGTIMLADAVLDVASERTLAVGAGQMSRVDAVNVAVMKAAGKLQGSVAASDAFFPFRDGLDAVARAGATAIVQPGGSVKDAEVIAAADEHGMAMVFTGRRHFRH